MYNCINCGAKSEELYKQYCSSVLKILKCEECDSMVDKYVEYDPVIVLVDFILMKTQTYRHILFNSNFKGYWKFLVVLWLVESFKNFSLGNKYDILEDNEIYDNNEIGKGISRKYWNFHIQVLHTGISLIGLFLFIIVVTELKWLINGKKPHEYNIKNLINAIIIGGCAELLGLLGVIWEFEPSGLHNILIQGYVLMSLTTAYSVVCNTGKIGSVIGLSGGIFAYHYIHNSAQISNSLREFKW